MAAFFFDTSGLVRRHVQEVGTLWVRSLTRPKAGHVLFLARITGVEMVAAITRRRRGGHLTHAQASTILGHFRRQFEQRFNLVELTPALTTQAMTLAQSHGLRGYDAVQLAAALYLQQSRLAAGLSGLTLISADAELNHAALAEGLTVDDPTNHA